MKHFTMHRRYFEHGTYSIVFRQNGSKVCCMVERPWRNNKASESCIPEGTYTMLPHESPTFGTCYALENDELGVTRYGPSLRTHILMHIANRPGELAGCLAPGVDFGYVGGEWAVVNSSDAWHAFMRELGGDPASITIKKD